MSIKNITAIELKEWIDSKKDFQLLDIREGFELDICKIENSDHIPMQQIGQRIGELSKEKPLVVYCHHGGRSQNICQALSSQAGFENVVNLEGGIDAWSRFVDSNVDRY